MAIKSALDLTNSGVHFGHRTSRWNPKMGRFIRSKQKLIHIIDVRETCKALAKATYFLENITAGGGKILFVGTKRAAQATIEETAKKHKMPYVIERWLGGCLTNHATVLSRLTRLEEIESMEKTGEIERYSKKMISSIMRQKRKLIRNLDGIRTLNKLPRVMFVIDPCKEEIAVKEARKLNIPVVALLDTDADPDTVDIAIPGNDDAMRSIQIIMSELDAAVERGVAKFIASGSKVAEDTDRMPTPEEGIAALKKKPQRGGGKGRGRGRGGRDKKPRFDDKSPTAGEKKTEPKQPEAKTDKAEVKTEPAAKTTADEKKTEPKQPEAKTDKAEVKTEPAAKTTADEKKTKPKQPEAKTDKAEVKTEPAAKATADEKKIEEKQPGTTADKAKPTTEAKTEPAEKAPVEVKKIEETTEPAANSAEK